MQLLTNKKAYNKDEWQKKFCKTDLYKTLQNEYDVVVFDKNSDMVSQKTPRQMWADPNPKTYFSATIFYYLEELFSTNPETVYDIGCGWNIFKKYYPNIIGIGAEPDDSDFYYADIHDYVDEIYIQGHQSHFDCFFSINALHFRPLSEVKLLMEELVSILTPGGSAFVTMNSQVLVNSDPNIENIFGKKNPRSIEVENYVRKQLADSEVIWHIVDIDLTVSADGLDGNIRLLFERPA